LQRQQLSAHNSQPMDFSPLLVGDAASTSPCVASSGIRLNFSPLLVGDAASTLEWPLRHFPQVQFQSPPRRGRCFNASPSSLVQSSGQNISVPSSSGTLLQQPIISSTHLLAFDFSPLLVGDAASTLHSRRLSSAFCDFSPLLVGDAASTLHSRRLSSAFCDFSPLLV